MLGKNSKDRTVPAEPQTKSASVPSHSVVGQGMTVSGDCTTEGHVRIQGTVAGNVFANGLELADSGVVEGDVSVPKGAAKKGQVFVVSGRVTGRVTAHIVDVKRTGVVLGGIDAEEATIHGSVEGGVDVRHRLAVSSTAVVNGDVQTDRLVMEEGGQVNGTIRMGRRAAAGTSGSDAPAKDKKLSAVSDSEDRADSESSSDKTPTAKPAAA